MLVLLQLINIMGLQCMESEISEIMEEGTVNLDHLLNFFDFIYSEHDIQLNESQRLLFKRVLMSGKYKSCLGMSKLINVA